MALVKVGLAKVGQHERLAKKSVWSKSAMTDPQARDDTFFVVLAVFHAQETLEEVVWDALTHVMTSDITTNVSASGATSAKFGEREVTRSASTAL